MGLPDARVLVPEDAEPSGAAGREVLARLDSDKRLVRLAAGDALDGLRLRPAPGHRSGHCIAEVGDDLVHLADVIHHPLHVEQPAADRVFDDDAAVALDTRERLLAEMAERAVVVTASHIAGPGRIARTAAGLRWQAL